MYLAELYVLLMHPVGRISISDWFVNSFIMVVYEIFFFSLVQKTTKKNFVIDKYYNTIYESVRIGYSSYRMLCSGLTFLIFLFVNNICFNSLPFMKGLGARSVRIFRINNEL